MPAPGNLSDLLYGLGTAQRLTSFSLSSTTVANGYYSLWKVAGHPGAGTTPPTGVGEIPTTSTTGAISFTGAAAGKRLYLARLSVTAFQQGTVMLYDRLWHNSGLSGTNTGVQTVNSASVNRPDGTGQGVELWAEIYTIIGASATTATASYTNQDGVAGRSATSSTIGSTGFREVNRMIRFNLQTGDTGVRSVESVQLAGTTGTAGDWGLTLVKRISNVSLAGGANGRLSDAFTTGMPVIPNNACLAVQYHSSTTTTGLITSGINLVEA